MLWWDDRFASGLSDDRAAEVHAVVLCETTTDPPDPGTERAFVMARGMTALYDAFIADGLDEDDAFRSVRAIMRAPFEDTDGLMSFLHFRYGVDPQRPDEAFSEAGVRFKEHGEKIWGPGFRYEQDVLDGDHSFVNVTRCFFFDYMRRVGRPALTSIVCELDILFADELSKPQYGMRFDRPTAMGMGGDCCRFQFTRTTRPQTD